MNQFTLGRRALITRAGGLAAVASALPLLSGCDAITANPAVRKILSMGEVMHQHSQRLLTDRTALAPEFTRAEVSPIFRANGTRMPSDPASRSSAASPCEWA